MVEAATGGEFWVRSEILEVEEPRLLVLRDEPQPEIGLTTTTVTRVELSRDGDKTRMTLTVGPYSAQMGEYAELGWLASIDKLAGLVGAAAV